MIRGPTPSASVRRRVTKPVLAGLLGCSITLYMFFSAGVDPWLWWSDYQERTKAPPLVQIRNPPAPGVVQPEPIGTDSSVSKSPRPLILSATRRGRNARDGTALIGISAGSPQTYKAGALLANGARVVEIYDDSIVLERDGRTVQLFVEGTEPPGYENYDDALIMVGGDKAAPVATADSRDELTDVMRISPVFAGDAVQALEVHANPSSDLFSKLGLQPGDQITTINGESVTDVSSSVGALRRLAHGEALQITVVRQGQLEPMSLDGLIITAAKSPTSN